MCIRQTVPMLIAIELRISSRVIQNSNTGKKILASPSARICRFHVIVQLSLPLGVSSISIDTKIRQEPGSIPGRGGSFSFATGHFDDRSITS